MPAPPNASLELVGLNASGSGWGDTDLDDAAGVHEMTAVGDDWTHLEFELRLSDGFSFDLVHTVAIDAP